MPLRAHPELERTRRMSNSTGALRETSVLVTYAPLGSGEPFEEVAVDLVRSWLGRAILVPTRENSELEQEERSKRCR